MNSCRISRGAALVICVCLSWFVATASAVELRLTPSTDSVTIAPGETVLIDGAVTNLTGLGLLTTEIFLNFSGFPADTLEITQLLGSPEVLIPNRTASASLDLFSISLLSGASAGSTYSFEWFAVDINGVFSDVMPMSVTVAGVVPEPTSLVLMVIGLLATVFLVKLRGSSSSVNRSP